MANGIKTRPVWRMTQAELDGFLERAADILRGNGDHSEFRGYVFALLFFRRISDLYQEEVSALTKKLGDEELARDPKMHNFVVPEGCLWEEVARKNPAQLGTALNEAMLAIERANQPKFDGILTNKIDFNKQDELPRSKLVDMSEVRHLELWDSEIPGKLLREGDIVAVEGHANSSSGLNTINRRGLRKLRIPQPRRGEQDDIIALIDAANSSIRAVEGELLAVRRLKTSLLQNLLTGKVRIRAEGRPCR